MAASLQDTGALPCGLAVPEGGQAAGLPLDPPVITGFGLARHGLGADEPCAVVALGERGL